MATSLTLVSDLEVGFDDRFAAAFFAAHPQVDPEGGDDPLAQFGEFDVAWSHEALRYTCPIAPPEGDLKAQAGLIGDYGRRGSDDVRVACSLVEQRPHVLDLALEPRLARLQLRAAGSGGRTLFRRRRGHGLRN